MSKSYQVFQTASSRRWFRFKWSLRILMFIGFLFTAAVVLAVIQNIYPSLPEILERNDSYEKLVNPSKGIIFRHSANKNYKGFKDVLLQSSSTNKLKGKRSVSSNSKLRVAFYTPWSIESYQSLQQHADKLNMVMPEWFFIQPHTYAVESRIDAGGWNIMKNHSLKIVPMLSNFDNSKGDFNSALANKILKDTVLQSRFIHQLTTQIIQNNFSGINIDLEEINNSSAQPLTHFVQKLSEAFHQQHLLVTIDVSANNDDYDIEQLSHYADYIVLMAYDEHYSESLPGTISGQQWIEQALDIAAKNIPSGKIILGIAGYGYDWPSGGKAVSISYQGALALAKQHNAIIEFDDDNYNLHFSYIDDSKMKHEVWFTDAASNFNTLRFADEYSVSGTALWRLGTEDERLWKFYNKDLSNSSLNDSPFVFNKLKYVPSSNSNINYNGDGEILDVIAQPSSGKIKLQVDTAGQIITEEKYESLPAGFIIKRVGEDTNIVHRKLVLSFDDGPDPVYTPKILDILEKEKVPASFFVVGMNAEANIPIVKRIYDDGYELGNHTFTHHNIATMSSDRAELEIKLTRMLIESITGHSTILFRAPYNADSEPHSYEELLPIARSKQENYYTVGESIDPMDWQKEVPADSIFQRVVSLENKNKGSIILLHDAGGSTREATIEALPRIIHYFKSKGYQFTTVANLMGKTKIDVMPSVSNRKDAFLIHLNYIIAETMYWGGKTIFSLFLLCIGLSISRMIFIGVLAGIQRKKEKAAAPKVAVSSANKPRVSIIVPAYNEQVNIVRTLQSLIQQDYPHLDIILVDDGSKDQTFQVAQKEFGNRPDVFIYTKPNGGKASALNYGISKTTSDFVICIDADTQLKSDAISLLMLQFTSESVAAVAGNVKVGNEVNFLTYWQSIEYTTAQNFDRRAFDLLNCITVVPGAIGAFRKEAIEKAGGFTSDTLAEDCDLTMRLHKQGYVIKNCTQAIAHTEAPENVSMFLKQRFRWSFGVMQSFWKHRDAFLHPAYKNFGRIAMPNILLFQILLPIMAPLADLILLGSLVAAGFHVIEASIGHIVLYYFLFTLVDVAAAVVAYTFEKEEYKKLWWLIPQRLVYRQFMYFVLFKSLKKAIKGELQEWGVLKRTGNVNKPALG